MMGFGMTGAWGDNWRNSRQWYGPGRMMGWSGSWWAWVIGFVELAVIVLPVVLLFRRRDGGRRTPDSLEILKELR
jgi:hypothetical protein